MAKKATVTKEPVPENEENCKLLKQVEELGKQLEVCQGAAKKSVEEMNEWKQKYEELLASPVPVFEPDPYLVVIPYKASEAQGNELMLAIRGWMKHFKENFRVVVVGDVEGLELPEVSGGCLEIGVVSHECQTDNPPLDIVAKLLAVIEEYPDMENLILTNDDIYPVNDFDIIEVMLLKADGVLTDEKRCGQLYKVNREKTLKTLQAIGKPIHDYGSHLPMFYNVETLIKMIETYNLTKEAMLISSLYFNTVYPSFIPFRLNMETDNLKVIVGRKNANLKLLREYIPRKIFVNNSTLGWSEEMEKVIENYV